MHIGFRTSGGGRGEFELVGRHGNIAAADLVGWSLQWDIPGIGECETGIWMNPGHSGKPRLRSKIPNERPQVGLQMAAILLLPRPVRERSSLGATEPVLRYQSYFLTRIGFKRDSIFDEAGKRIVVKPSYIWAENRIGREIIYFDHRWERVQKLHDTYMIQQQFGDVLSVLQNHQDSLQERNVFRSTVSQAEKVNKVLQEMGDAVPVLEKMFDLTPEEFPILDIEEIEEDDVEMRIASTSIMRMARARPQSARNFSVAVRDAWGHACAFCGLELPGRIGRLDSGVDGAHILPWAEHGIDDIRNGICLCKLHHWAFDQAILTLHFEDQKYVVKPSPLMGAYDVAAQTELMSVTGPIPEDRLPSRRHERPNPHYINELNGAIDVAKLKL